VYVKETNKGGFDCQDAEAERSDPAYLSRCRNCLVWSWLLWFHVLSQLFHKMFILKLEKLSQFVFRKLNRCDYYSRLEKTLAVETDESTASLL